jgi:hypothetical protein
MVGLYPSNDYLGEGKGINGSKGFLQEEEQCRQLIYKQHQEHK